MTKKLKTKSADLHAQTIVDVLVELSKCESDRSEYLQKLVSEGQFFPLSLQCETIRNLVSEGRFLPLHTNDNLEVSSNASKGETLMDIRVRTFGKGRFDAPLLEDDFSLPWEFAPTALETQRILKDAIDMSTSYRFLSECETPEEEQEGIEELVENIPNPKYSGPGCIVCLDAPQYDKAKDFSMVWPADGIVWETTFRATIIPCGSGLWLEHSEYYCLSTLTTGTMLWVGFPPTDANLALLLEHHESKAFGKPIETGTVHRDMLLELEHGIVFVQQAGQTLYMPPFCTHVSMGIENCTSAYYYVATATQFPAALKHIPWRVAVIRREAPEMHQTQLADYASAILYTLEQVLRGDFDKALNIVALHKNMCDSWNENKDKVYALCAAIEDPTKADGFKDGFKRAWIEFLERKCVLQENGKKLATCQLCKNPINKMSGNKADRLVRHFLQKHWPRADANGVQEAVDKVEIARFTEGKAHQIGKARKGA